MGLSTDQIFLDCSVRRLRECVKRIEDCLGRVPAEAIWTRGGENENAIGNLVLHLDGNVRQWIICGAGGSPDTRDRDSEFDARGGASAPELAARLHQTVEEACTVIAALSPEKLVEKHRIQAYDVTIFEAVYHVVEHFAYHTGQVIYATKAVTGQDLGYYAYLRKRTAGEVAP